MRDYLYNLATDKHKGLIVKFLKAILFIFSLVYGLIIRILIFLYQIKPQRLNCKVISVGNITLGGTGKTSLVEYIAKYLKQNGHKVAILTRGYKRKVVSGQWSVVSYAAMGDEPYMLQQNLGGLPVIVDPDRIRSANLAIQDYNVDTVILDDGLQQWRIKKDLEIVTIDATDPFGNQYLLPRGILREPLSALKRADIFILTKTNLNPDILEIEDFLERFNPGALIVRSIHSPVGLYLLGENQNLFNNDILKGKIVTLFSGIATPDSFENLIESLGANIGLSFRFADHYPYGQEDLEKIIQESQKKNIDTIVTTQKDSVRISHLTIDNYPLRIFVLGVELKIIQNEKEFHYRLLKLYNP